MADTIYDLFGRVTAHPDFIGGTIFTREDVPEGRALPSDWRNKWLSDPLAEKGSQILEDIAEDAGGSANRYVGRAMSVAAVAAGALFLGRM